MEEALLNTSFIHRRAEVPSTWQCFLIKNSKGLQLTLGIRITSGNLKKKKNTQNLDGWSLVPVSSVRMGVGGWGWEREWESIAVWPWTLVENRAPRIMEGGVQ